MKTETEKTKYECELCKKVFSGSRSGINSYKSHMKDAHKDPSYKCDTCGKTFQYKKNLVNHVTNVHGNVGAKCTYENCSKEFRAKLHLKRHIEYFHEKTKTIKCELCPKTFKTKSELKSHHKNIHNDVKTEKINLAKHIESYLEIPWTNYQDRGAVFLTYEN